MDVLQRTVDSIRSSLRQLSATARLLIGSLVVILAMTLFLVALYAGQSSLVPLPIALTADTRANAISYLETSQIPHELRGGQVLVPASQQYSILADLTESEIISTSDITFESLFENDSPFTSNSDKRRRYLVATMNVVARMLKQTRDIEDAKVVISQPERSTPLGQPDIRPSATVTVTLREGTLDQARADGIARMVAGAHASLSINRVEVIDARTLRALRPRTDEDMAGSRYLETKLSAEKHVAQMLREHLDYIPGVRISVNAQVDATRVEARRDNYEDAKIAPVQESSRVTTSTNRNVPGEPGVRPNTGVAIASGGSGSQYSDEQTDARMQPVFGGQKEHILDDRGHPLKINATISIPRSHYVGIFRAEAGDPDAAADGEAIAQIEQDVIARVKASVEPLIETDAISGSMPGVVQVGSYYDYALVAMSEAATEGSSAGFGLASPMAQPLIRYVGLGGLAIISVAMMLLMVRRATSHQELPTAEELVGVPPALQTEDSDLVGEAAETPTPMDGLEIDEDALRREQMLEQINEMAANDTDEAAGLIRRWVRSDH